MPDETTYMRLTKPLTGELANISVINANMDKLDGHRHGGGTDGLSVRGVQAGTFNDRPAAGTAGQLYVATNTNQLFFDNGAVWKELMLVGAAGVIKIAEVSLTAPLNTIDFTGIPLTYKHLKLEAYWRGDAATTYVDLTIRFNNDGTNNYDSQRVHAAGSAAGGYSQELQNSGLVGSGPAANGPANAFAMASITVPHYANGANKKMCSSVVVRRYGTLAAEHPTEVYGVYWAWSTAIGQITLRLSNGNFAAGTVVTLYGLA